MKQLKNFITELDLGGKLTILILLLAVGLLGYDTYERFKYIEVTSISSPVELVKTEYRAGDAIIGKFKGDLIPNGPFIVARRLECDSQRIALNNANLNTPSKTILDGSKETVIILLAPEETLTKQDINPDTNCKITFVNTYEKHLPLGGVRTLEVRYFTENFDILK